MILIYAGVLSVDQLNEKKFTTAYLPITAFEYVRKGNESAANYRPTWKSTCNPGFTHALSEEISSRIGAFMLPVQPFGARVTQNAGCGIGDNEYINVGVEPGLLYEMVLDLARCLRGQGFRRLVLHRGHPGLTMLYPLTRHLNAVEGVKTVLVYPGALISATNSGTQAIIDDREVCGCVFSEAVRLSVEYINKAFIFMDKNGAYAPKQA